jgi:hypothetical protein
MLTAISPFVAKKMWQNRGDVDMGLENPQSQVRKHRIFFKKHIDDISLIVWLTKLIIRVMNFI